MEPQESVEQDEVADRMQEEFKVSLPGQNLPTPMRFIAFFTLIGGFSIIGSLFVDIVRPMGEDLSSFILRITAGIIAIATAYGIIEHRRWSIWLYGMFALLAILTNPLLSIIPLAVVVYLCVQRKYLKPSFLDVVLARIVWNIKNRLGFKNSDEMLS